MEDLFYLDFGIFAIFQELFKHLLIFNISFTSDFIVIPSLPWLLHLELDQTLCAVPPEGSENAEVESDTGDFLQYKRDKD